MKIYLFLFLLTLRSGVTIRAQNHKFLQTDSAFLQGYIHDFSASKTDTTSIVSLANALTGGSSPIVLSISSEGTFKVVLPLQYPISNQIEIGPYLIPFYICPRDTLNMDIKLNTPADRPEIKYWGRNARINQELEQVHAALKFPKVSYPDQQSDSLRQDYGRRVMHAYRAYCRKVSEYAREHSLTSVSLKLLQDEALMRVSAKLLLYEQQYFNPDMSSVLDPTVDPYYTFLRKVNWDDSCLLSTYSFAHFIKMFDYPFMAYKKWLLADKALLFFATLERMKHPLTEKEKQLKTYFEKSKPEDPEYTVKLTELQRLQAQYQDNNIHGIAEQLVIRDLLFEQDWKWNGFIYEITKLHLLHVGLGFSSNRTEALDKLQILLPELKDPYLIQVAHQAVEVAFPEKQVDFVLPLGKASEIFQNLIDTLKGKIVLIDIWATWCPGCVEGIANLQSIRETYGKKGVAFVFVCSQNNAPLTAYHRIMDPVDGYKYRLTQDEYNYLCEMFKIDAIPHYILVDQKGKVIHPNYGLQHLTSTLDRLLAD